MKRHIWPTIVGILLFVTVYFQGCTGSPVLHDVFAGAAESSDLSAHIGGGQYIGDGLIKLAPTVGTATENVVVTIQVPSAKALECESASCAVVEIRDGAQVLKTKTSEGQSTAITFNFQELLGTSTFAKENDSILGVKVTLYYKGTEIMYFGEIRLKPVAAGYHWLTPRDPYAAFVWTCFDPKHECGLSTKGRSYVVTK